jgi:hypothetical protein
MTKRVSRIATARAQKANDSRKWTPKELLEELLDQIKNGDVKPRQIAVHWFEDAGEDNVGAHRFLAANSTWMDHLALLEVGMADMIDRLRG